MSPSSLYRRDFLMLMSAAGALAAIALITTDRSSGHTKSPGPAPSFPKSNYWNIRDEDFRPFI